MLNSEEGLRQLVKAEVLREVLVKLDSLELLGED